MEKVGGGLCSAVDSYKLMIMSGSGGGSGGSGGGSGGGGGDSDGGGGSGGSGDGGLSAIPSNEKVQIYERQTSK